MTSDLDADHGSHPIMWGDETIAVLLHGQDGDYLVPPVVFNTAGELIMGHDVLEAIVQSGIAIEHPVLRGFNEAKLADLEQRLAKVSEDLGIDFLSG